MKKTIKIWLALTGTLFALGLALNLVGTAMGGRRESRQYYEERWEDFSWNNALGPIQVNSNGVHIGGKNGIHVDSDGVDIGGEHGIHVGHHNENGYSGEKQLVESGALSGITAIEVDVDCGDIRLQEGEAFSVSLDWNLSNYVMSYQVEDGVLKVEDESWGNTKTPFNVTCAVLVTIPSGANLDEVDLSTNMGNIEVDTAISVKEASFSTELGDVTAKALQATSLEAESDLGDVTVAVPAECKSLSYTLSTDLGEVYFNGEIQKNPTIVVKSDQKYYVEATTSLGNVNLEYQG